MVRCPSRVKPSRTPQKVCRCRTLYRSYRESTVPKTLEVFAVLIQFSHLLPAPIRRFAVTDRSCCEIMMQSMHTSPHRIGMATGHVVSAQESLADQSIHSEMAKNAAVPRFPTDLLERLLQPLTLAVHRCIHLPALRELRYHREVLSTRLRRSTRQLADTLAWKSPSNLLMQWSPCKI